MWVCESFRPMTVISNICFKFFIFRYKRYIIFIHAAFEHWIQKIMTRHRIFGTGIPSWTISLRPNLTFQTLDSDVMDANYKHDIIVVPNTENRSANLFPLKGKLANYAGSRTTYRCFGWANDKYIIALTISRQLFSSILVIYSHSF